MSEEKAVYSSGREQGVSRAIAEKTIAYRPSLRVVAKSTNGAILLQQIAWYWYANKEKPFYKFIQPCEHEMYREGDSWTEELSFSYSELTTALSNFASKVEGGTSKKELSDNHSVIYWTDADRVTWWQFNGETFEKLYNFKLLGNSEKANYPVIPESPNTLIGINTESTRDYFKGKKSRKKELASTSIENAIWADEPVTDEMAELSRLRDVAPKMFEAALGFSKPLPWWTGKEWDAFSDWVVEQYAKDRNAFGEYNIWRAAKYTKGALPNTRIRGFPAEFYDSWDMFRMSKQPAKETEMVRLL